MRVSQHPLSQTFVEGEMIPKLTAAPLAPGVFAH